jgi:hypothetical protein
MWMVVHMSANGNSGTFVSPRGTAAAGTRNQAYRGSSPFGAYVPKVQTGKLLFLSGMLPMGRA